MFLAHLRRDATNGRAVNELADQEYVGQAYQEKHRRVERN